MTRIVAFVPMRHDSLRVPGKNYRSFAGKPLYHWIVEKLLTCPSISAVVIDTDSPFIIEDAAAHFPTVELIERPEHLRDGNVPMNDVLLNSVRQIEADFYLQTHSTNPLLKSTTIQRGIETFLANYPTFDSIFSVTRVQKRLWDSLTRPINHNSAILLRTQDLPPVFEENSCFYMFTRATLEQQRNRLGVRPLMFEIDPLEAQDIDEEIDFAITEQLYRYFQKED